MEFQPTRLYIGVRPRRGTMLWRKKKPSSPNEPLPRVRFDFIAKKLWIFFSVSSRNSKPGAAQTTSSHGNHDSLDIKACIELSQIKEAIVTQNGNDSIVIWLRGPPIYFSRKLRSHHQWKRLPGIFVRGPEADKQPTSLHRQNDALDLGAWTCYQFELGNGSSDLIGHLRDNLLKINIELERDDNFEVAKGAEAELWSLIDERDHGESHNAIFGTSWVAHPLPFEVRYQLEVCLSQRLLSPYSVSREFLEKLTSWTAEGDRGRLRAVGLLEYIADKGKFVEEPMAVFEQAPPPTPVAKLQSYCAMIRKVVVTPTTIYLSSPTVEMTNRVLRQFSALGDRFLRVQFTDELPQGRLRLGDAEQGSLLFGRIRRTLFNGIRIGDRKYEYLACGNSQLREFGAWFFCPTEQVSCQEILRWMGVFDHITNVAKYNARLGQCFSTTREVGLRLSNIRKIPDIERNGFCFTDGVGKISSFLAKIIQGHMQGPAHVEPASAYQVRIAGSKGVLVVWPEAEGMEIQIRPSQEKFPAQHEYLEIVRAARYSTPTLNRQTVTILSCLGVLESGFLALLQEQLDQYDRAATDKRVAIDLLTRFIDENQMTVELAEWLRNGFMESQEPFVNTVLLLWRSWSLKLLKDKARIMVEQGAFVIGVVDETGKLRGHSNSTLPEDKAIDSLPQIFLQIPEPQAPDKYKVIEGVCVLGRNPSLHPGDIRVVQAVDVPQLRHLRDVVVFPATGDRDIPSMCSGGDLDGDDFFVFWDPRLLPSEWNPAPMEATETEPKKNDKTAKPVSIKDLKNFFVDYLKHDSLGLIAHAHLAHANRLAGGAKHPRCLQLARLHSTAVDFVKTGKPAELDKQLLPSAWPHFMEKRRGASYRATTPLGKIYDQVERLAFSPLYTLPFDSRILEAYILDDSRLGRVRAIKGQYDTVLRRILEHREISTEFELWTAFVLAPPRIGSGYKQQEDVGREVYAFKERFRSACIQAAGSRNPQHLEPFVAAMYRATYDELQAALEGNSKTIPFISFPWLFSTQLCRIAKSGRVGIQPCELATDVAVQDGGAGIEEKRGELDEGLRHYPADTGDRISREEGFEFKEQGGGDVEKFDIFKSQSNGVDKKTDGKSAAAHGTQTDEEFSLLRASSDGARHHIEAAWTHEGPSNGEEPELGGLRALAADYNDRVAGVIPRASSAIQGQADASPDLSTTGSILGGDGTGALDVIHVEIEGGDSAPDDGISTVEDTSSTCPTPPESPDRHQIPTIAATIDEIAAQHMGYNEEAALAALPVVPLESRATTFVELAGTDAEETLEDRLNRLGGLD